MPAHPEHFRTEDDRRIRLIDDYPVYRELLARNDAPPGSSWGVFGDDDQLGTLNFLVLADLADAARTVRAGRAYSLNLRSDAITSSLAPTREPFVHNIFQRTPFHRDEWLDRFYLQYATQIDGLRHIGHPDYGFYNGADGTDFQPGTERLGIHHFTALPIAGRAVVADIDGYLQSIGGHLDHDAGQPVELETLCATLEHQGSTIKPGDIVLVRFGWLGHYRDDSSADWRKNLVVKQFHTGMRQDRDLLEWLWDHRVAMVAADNFAFECWPAGPDSPFFAEADRSGVADDPHAGIMHRELIALLGMPIGELWDLDRLAADCAADGRYECLVTVSPLPVVGGVGSPANAIALR
ncbi:cyclase family protein [Gordonia sp. TBRC 11910]|uniref:Cyclase family protein n=1 Tax=Gordonia asplenii TaxID=2725283 RepID=A0A848L1Q0_9ACTN|nr:cyclase family protein [Gordonia asplenii]NMO04639.1 cyclase family protein [Gordonia asplenii]